MEATTSERIITAASTLFYGEGIRGVSMDAVAEKAGVTKRTLYYHFKSKDDLVAAYLHGRDQPNLALFEQWFTGTEGGAQRRPAAFSPTSPSPPGTRSGRGAASSGPQQNLQACPGTLR